MEPKTLPPALAEIKQSHFFHSAALRAADTTSLVWLFGVQRSARKSIEANEDYAQNSKTAYNFPANFSKRISHVMLFGVYHTKNISEH